MLVLTILTTAFAADCGLGAIDPASACNVVEGYANFDVDSVAGGSISLSLSTIDAQYVDHDSKTHGPHPASLLTTELDSNDRFVLTCPDTTGDKTLKVSVTRPSNYTRFGGEWVKLYQKDSWTEVKSETEPYTFNNFGSKVPLDDASKGGVFRTAPAGLDDTSELLTDTVNVFMSVDATGDYEFKYGNPAFKSGCPETGCVEGDDASGNWVAMEFKSTLLRAGTPWATCGADASYGTVGSIVPLFLGNPNLNREAYDAAIAAIQAVTFPVYVVLPLAPLGGEAWTDAEAPETPGAACDGLVNAMCCYSGKSNQLVVNNYAECEAHCNAKAAELGNIAGCELMPIDGTNKADRSSGGTCSAETSCSYMGAHENCAGARCGGAYGTAAVPKLYSTCFAMGNACPDDNSVCSAGACNVQQWRQIAAALRTNANVKVLGDISASASGADRSQADMNADISASAAVLPDIDGYFFSGASGDVIAQALRSVSAGVKAASQISVISVGSALLDDGAVDVADVFVTQTGADLGAWTPFSWYPTYATTKWAAMATEVSAVDATATALFDRGYGFVYLHSEKEFSSPHTGIIAALARVSTQVVGLRRLQVAGDRRLAEGATYKWSCDDTLFECSQICLKTAGVTTVKVADSECEGAPLDACACPCLFSAAWTCQDGAVVCEATSTETMAPRAVGDLVCASRGSPKPAFAQLEAGSCKAPVARGTTLTPTCAARHEARVSKLAEERSQAAQEVAAPEERPGLDLDVVESSAVPIVIAAFALLA